MLQRKPISIISHSCITACQCLTITTVEWGMEQAITTITSDNPRSNPAFLQFHQKPQSSSNDVPLATFLSTYADIALRIGEREGVCGNMAD